MASFTFSQLTPTAFLERSARVFPERTAAFDGDRRFTYRQFADRSRRLAGALAARGVVPGDRVAALCGNSSVMLELHHGVPWAGAVLVPLNVRLSPAELGYILRLTRRHGANTQHERRRAAATGCRDAASPTSSGH